jgi:hypothetical protein
MPIAASCSARQQIVYDTTQDIEPWGRAMLRGDSFLLFVLVAIVGCGPSAQEKYDAAVKNLELAQARLDNLRPAYDAAREKAALTVCKEIAGVTPDESAMAALTQLGGVADQSVASQAADSQLAANSIAIEKRTSDADDAIDQLLAAHKTMQEQQAAMTGPISKAYDTMNKIKTPGTPEAKRFDEVLANMPEVEAYQRQEKRVERANQDVDDAEADLPEPEHGEAK